MQQNKLVVFESKSIRRIWHNDEWWFSVADVVETLTDSVDTRQYIKRMRQRDPELDSYWGTICTPLELLAPDGKRRKTNCSNTEGLFRIIQSIPSPKAEPFKRWLAKVGHERIQEIENPELAQERMKQLYEQKGYPKDWIDKRLRGIAIRQNLTDEWQERGISTERDFSILTAEIAKATFGVTPSEHKDLKGLTRKNDNLRDHMTDLELIFTMLGEKVTTEISQTEKPDTFDKNKKVAKRGGSVAGTARKETERELGRSVVSKQNFLPKKKSEALLALRGKIDIEYDWEKKEESEISETKERE
jgi:prophage antirepressor-like protein